MIKDKIKTILKMKNKITQLKLKIIYDVLLLLGDFSYLVSIIIILINFLKKGEQPSNLTLLLVLIITIVSNKNNTKNEK